jgi:hypothetical protein
MTYAKHTFINSGTFAVPAVTTAAPPTAAPTPLANAPTTAPTKAPVVDAGTVTPIPGPGAVIGEVTVRSQIVNATTIDMELSVAKGATDIGWIAVGFGGGHRGVDSVHCSIAAAVIYDTYHLASGRDMVHKLDATKDTTIVEVAQEAATTRCRFTRSLNTGDAAGDVVLTPGGNVTLGLAYGTGGITPGAPDAAMTYTEHTYKISEVYTLPTST